ncbi:MAG: ABC transporter permease [Thermoplasmata archaeon]
MYPAVDAIRRRPGRSALASLGIGLAAALVVLLLALSSGIQTSSTQLAAASGIDLLSTSANTSLSSSTFPPIPQSHPLASEIPANDSNVEVASPWLVSDLVFGNASLWAAANDSPNGSAIPAAWALTGSGSVGWIPSDNTGIEVPTLYSGSGFTYPGDPHYANGTYDGPVTGEVVLDQGLASVIRVGVGDLVWTSPSSAAGPEQVEGWYAQATAFRVVGVSSPFWLLPSAFLGFFYLSELQTMLGSGSASADYASLILIHLYDASNPGADAVRIAAAFPQLSVFTLQSILGAVQGAITLYRTFGEIVGAIGLVVAALFTTTVVLMSVDDRSREIALRRAIGHTRASVGLMVVEEAVLLSLIGLAIGLPLAFLATDLLNVLLLQRLGDLPTGFSFVSFDLGVIGAGVAIVVGIGLAAGIAPAARAMQLPIAEELRAP